MEFLEKFWTKIDKGRVTRPSFFWYDTDLKKRKRKKKSKKKKLQKLKSWCHTKRRMVWQRLRTLATFLRNAAHLFDIFVLLSQMRDTVINQLNGRGLGPKQIAALRNIRGNKVNSWIDAPDDVYFFATDNTRFVKIFTLTIFIIFNLPARYLKEK